LAASLAVASGGAADSPVLAARSLLLNAQVAGHTIIAVGAYGHVLRSVDDGRTWEVAAVPTLVTLTAAHFPDARNGWAVGHDAQVLHSADGGRTWTRQYQGSDPDAPLLSVLFLDAENGFAVGAYGQYLSTTDGGRTWTPRRIIEQDRHFNRITVGPAGTLYIAGEQGTLLRSTDRGAAWRAIPSPYDGSFYGILPLGPEVLLAHGLRGRIYRSENNGETWQLVPVAPRVLLATAVRLRSGAIVLAGQARAFLVSRDDGRSFAPWAAPLTTPVAELVETADGRLLAFGEAGVTALPEP
jgi:photosystem II stability/assembly factor-like uncharacterized protein